MLESFYGNKFTYKKLTEEEQQKRGILGRLVGVIADTKNPTRNGRTYGKKLWENVFNDPIIKEKIRTKTFFGELDHPADRETVDSSKIAICLAEEPKLGDDGKLYGVFDILNTPNGKILKTLCDYGSSIGVSSRGSGDIMDDDQVDPSTYYCECFDAVILPAVETARPKFVTESLNTKKNLRQALTEALQSASTEDKKIMKETLDNLNIKLDEDVKKVITTNEQEIQMVPEDILLEDAEEDETPAEPDMEPEIEEEPKTELHEVETEPTTVGEFIATFDNYDASLPIEWGTVTIDGKTYQFDDLTIDDSDKNKLVLIPDYNLPEEEVYNINDETSDEKLPEESEDAEDKSSNVEKETDESEVPSKEAVDNGNNEVIESLKESIRQNGLLKSKIRELENQKAVSDTEVHDLRESLERYKSGFERVSELASKAKKFEQDNKNLIEQLSKQKQNSNSLTESVDASKKQVNKLVSQIASIQNEAEETKNRLNESLRNSKTKLQEAAKLITTYKNKYKAVTERYIETKAKMLGVRSIDITKKLNENFTLDDVDNICDEMLNADRPTFSLKGYGKPSIKINESKLPEKKNVDDGYDIDDSLLELAGLK